ncbi:MAG: hypothetical protein PVG14_07205 [Anaerolineales bacterium]|jgi:hypothetical protein
MGKANLWRWWQRAPFISEAEELKESILHDQFVIMRDSTYNSVLRDLDFKEVFLEFLILFILYD